MDIAVRKHFPQNGDEFLWVNRGLPNRDMRVFLKKRFPHRNPLAGSSMLGLGMLFSGSGFHCIFMGFNSIILEILTFFKLSS